MGPHEDVTPERDDVPEESEGSTPPPVDPEVERMEKKRKALKLARDALRDTAVFGSSKTFDPVDLIILADWILDEGADPKDDEGGLPEPESITPEVLSNLPQGTVILDAVGRAYQCDYRRSHIWCSTIGRFTSEEMVNSRGVEVIYVPSGERHGG